MKKLTREELRREHRRIQKLVQRTPTPREALHPSVEYTLHGPRQVECRKAASKLLTTLETAADDYYGHQVDIYQLSCADLEEVGESHPEIVEAWHRLVELFEEVYEDDPDFRRRVDEYMAAHPETSDLGLF